MNRILIAVAVVALLVGIFIGSFIHKPETPQACHDFVAAADHSIDLDLKLIELQNDQLEAIGKLDIPAIKNKTDAIDALTPEIQKASDNYKQLKLSCNNQQEKNG